MLTIIKYVLTIIGAGEANHSVIFFALISPELYLKTLFSSFIKDPQSLPVDIRENYPKI